MLYRSLDVRAARLGTVGQILESFGNRQAGHQRLHRLLAVIDIGGLIFDDIAGTHRFGVDFPFAPVGLGDNLRLGEVDRNDRLVGLRSRGRRFGFGEQRQRNTRYSL